MKTPATKEFISDAGAQKLLGIDEFALCNLILDCDLIPYRKAADRPDYEIAHDVYETPEDVLFEIGGLVFKRAAVDAYAKVRQSALVRLQIQRSNVVHLQDDRTVNNMPPLPRLDSALEYIEKRIERAKSVKPETDNELQVLIYLAYQEAMKIYDGIRFHAGLKNNQPAWKKAALQVFRANEKKFAIIREQHLLNEAVYSFAAGQEKRDFLNKLISRAMQDHEYEISEKRTHEILKTIKQR